MFAMCDSERENILIQAISPMEDLVEKVSSYSVHFWILFVDGIYLRTILLGWRNHVCSKSKTKMGL